MSKRKIINVPFNETEVMDVEVVGPRLLHYMRRGVPITKITAYFTRLQCHTLFPQTVARNPKQFQLDAWIFKGEKREVHLNYRDELHSFVVRVGSAPAETREPYQKAKADPATTAQRAAAKALYDALIGLGFLPSLADLEKHVVHSS